MLNDVQRDKIKKHFQDHKKKYVVAGTVVGVGAVAAGSYILGTNTSTAIANGDGSSAIGTIRQVGYKSTQTMEVTVKALGHPGNVIQDMATGNIYASQGQAAKALGVSPGVISQHLRGLRPDVQGHELVNLGKASV